MRKVLTIAGSDSGGGAGIQADLKTITVLGAYGMSAITALTAQNTMGVQAIYPVSPAFVVAQIEAAVADIGLDAAKTGMLATTEMVEAVAEAIARFSIRPLIVDPVMYAKSGHELLGTDARTVFAKMILPLADLVTPNLAEASVLSGREVTTEDDCRTAARIIYNKGAKAVLIKGGHAQGECAEDLLFDGTNYHTFSAPRISSRHTHGIGCTYSAAIATYLAQGHQLLDAVAKAKTFITNALRFSVPIGKGIGPTNPYGAVTSEFQRYQVLHALQEVGMIISRDARFAQLSPEVQSNLGYALPCATTIDDVAAFPGRLVRLPEGLVPVRPPAFGASRHIAHIILTAMRFDPSLRAAMNIRYSTSTLSRASSKGLVIATFARKQEPEDIKNQEGATLEWGVAQALQGCEKTPDLIYDIGDIGKEPMIRVLGVDPQDILRKLRLLI